MPGGCLSSPGITHAADWLGWLVSGCWLLGAVILFAATGEIIERSLNFFYQRSFSCLLLVGGSAFHRATNMQGGGDLFRSYKFVKYPADVGAPVRALREARVKGVYTGDGRDGGRGEILPPISQPAKQLLPCAPTHTHR